MTDTRRPPPEVIEYIRRKKAIEYQFAEPYMSPVVEPVSEPQLREKVRAALMELPKSDWVEMQCELEQAYKATIGDESPLKDPCADHE